MPGTPKDFDSSANRDSAGGSDVPIVTDRVQELTWALVDEGITDGEFALLDNLLLSDDNARETYLECMHLHADLMAHFAAPATKVGSAAAKTSPILGFLNSGNSSMSLDLPSAEDAKS